MLTNNNNMIDWEDDEELKEVREDDEAILEPLEFLINWRQIVLKRLLIFIFKRSIVDKYKAKVWQKEQTKEIRNLNNFLMILFSPRIIVGLSICFKEYLIDYIHPFKYLLFAKNNKFKNKIFILSCLNSWFLHNELVKINYFFFLFCEFHWKQLKCTAFNSNFFMYKLLNKLTDSYLTCIMENKYFLLKLSFRLFYYFFCYAEHFRSIKYNEYIVSHISLSKNISKYLLRKEFILLYFNWQIIDIPLADGYARGYRKGLLGRYYILYDNPFSWEARKQLLFTTIEFRIFCLDQSFIFLNFLKKGKFIRKFFVQLNRQAIRHNLRTLVYIQIMKKDRKWKWFHSSSFETWLDFVFFAFRKYNSFFVYKIAKQFCQKKLLNWQLRQSSIVVNYFCSDLIIFKKKGLQNFSEDFFWNEFSLSVSYINLLITNIFNEFFIRIVGQLDFSYMPTWGTVCMFFHKYRVEFHKNLLFYIFDTSIYISESFLFVLDYFLWRVWYSYTSFSLKTVDVYNVTASYDKLVVNRYFNLEVLFNILQTQLHFEVFSLYVLIRDLIYKNFKKEFKFLIFIFFLNLNLKPIINNFYFYDYKCQINFYNFWKIAPEYEREINLNYITDPLVLDVKKSRKKSIQDTYIW